MSGKSSYPFGMSTATASRVAAVVVMLFGAGLFAYGFRVTAQASRQKDWPSVAATVESSRVGSHLGKDNKRIYQAVVDYVYRVEGTAHRGRTLFQLGRTQGAQINSREFEGRYPKGSPLDVFYNPAAPAESVLQRQVAGEAWKVHVAGLVMLVFGALIWHYAPRNKD